MSNITMLLKQFFFFFLEAVAKMWLYKMAEIRKHGVGCHYVAREINIRWEHLIF